MGDKVKKIQAFKELVKLAKEGFDLYSSESADMYGGGRRYEFRLLEPLLRPLNNKEYVLSNILSQMPSADNPKSIERIEKERKLVHLLLEAGANPNCFERGYRGTRIFDSFFETGKYYAALEIAKSPTFSCSDRLEFILENLSWDLEGYLKHGRDSFGKTEEDKIKKVDLDDKKELAYLLFQKGMYPRDAKVFEKLSPIVLERDPEFFNKKKKQLVAQISRAKTPIQIYNALMGKRKEKN